jgi:IS30 family transposase
VKKFIDEKLGMEQWSHEQISGYCKKHGIAKVSPERIYQYVYQDKKLGGKLYKNLRIASKPYRKRYGSKDYRGKIAGRISIDQRQEVVNQRSRIGDWEADTIIGKNHKQAILTTVERKSKFLVMALLSKNGSFETRKAMINCLAPYKPVYTITSDNGREFTEHKIIAEKLNAHFYFAHPYSAWEKGTNENTNALIRQYIPKKSDFQQITLEQINEIMQKLNNRPRKSLNYTERT